MDNSRLDVSVFRPDMPIDKIVNGYYSDKYFNRTYEVLLAANRNPVVTYQVFQKQDAILGGIDEAIAIIRLCATAPDVHIEALNDGDKIRKFEPVLKVTGPAQSLMCLETAYLGVLKRGTAIATNVHSTVEAANGKPVLFFAARFDHYRVQTSDGYAAYKSGAAGVSTDANAWWQGTEGIGTMPHAMIAAFGGDTVEAALAFDEYIEDGINRIPLVDWDNDCINTTVNICRAFQQKAIAAGRGGKPSNYIGEGKGKVYGVRFDTSGNMRDDSVPAMSPELSLGVCPQLITLAREAFDHEGWEDLKIAVSGGFTPEKITAFEKMRVPVDIYGVGSSIYSNMNKYDFTSDIVIVDGELCAKVGRGVTPTNRLKTVG